MEEIVADASAFLSVVLNEHDRDWVIDKTLGYTIVSPEVLPYEIGNALIAVRKRDGSAIGKSFGLLISHRGLQSN